MGFTGPVALTVANSRNILYNGSIVAQRIRKVYKEDKNA
jgi:hypothetical protein